LVGATRRRCLSLFLHTLDRKLLLAAHDDAAAFIASNGQLRGAQLESALIYLRRTQSKLHASDLELAQAILVQ
ncbi:DUF2388 domain-containing protein, partial [Pseudomonas sp. AL03]|uniref:DUF2388 domain-containing protein n=1 Tax=Pseudomonas sp. AL03 TaxID=3042230 RepID=UPI00249A2A49